MRVKSPRIKRHKKILKLAKGYRMTKHRLYKVAREAVLHAGQYAYDGRKLRKRDFRRLWITRINAALSETGVNYQDFIHGLKAARIDLDRKILADLAVSDPEAIKVILAKLDTAT
ncbi:50S ribosomal protein L20 [Candidatus Shapirobacteria bacterium]|nr:50S ribosomal protein L20 [Candidatus Shapirobacteria bacterium]